MKSGSPEAFQQGLGALAERARAGGAETLTAAVRALAPMLPGLEGLYAKTAVLAGACVEWGASPLPLVDGLPERAAEAMMLNAFAAEWLESYRIPLPKRTLGNARKLRELFSSVVEERGGTPPQGLGRLCWSWYDMEEWLMPLLTLLARDEFRDALSPKTKAELREHAAAVGERSPSAAWVGTLAEVLDDEPLLVLDPEARRGYALTMRGIGDNTQLHILLADRLIGDPAAGLVAGPRPDPAWVAAATDADPQLGLERAAVRAFRLFDGRGRHLAPEGRPADIQPLDGTRVLAIHPPNGRFAMGAARVFADMRPTLILDRRLGPDEVETWLTRVAPAVQDDLPAPR